MNYNFLNGVPRRVTLFATPIEQRNDIKADLGIFAQDSWAMSRMTINYGVRFDYLNAAVPEQHLAAGRFVPERNFAAVKNAPNWKDINPRIGVSLRPLRQRSNGDQGNGWPLYFRRQPRVERQPGEHVGQQRDAHVDRLERQLLSRLRLEQPGDSTTNAVRCRT